jgi:hypothetical protein
VARSSSALLLGYRLSLGLCRRRLVPHCTRFLETTTVRDSVQFFPRSQSPLLPAGVAKPRSLESGMASGVESFAMGIFRGITGTVHQPLKQFRRDGAAGLVTGVLSGLVGVVAEPIAGNAPSPSSPPIRVFRSLCTPSGAMDAISLTAKGVRSEIVATQDVSRVRRPRHIGPDRVLTPYRADWALAQDVLWQCGKVASLPLLHPVVHFLTVSLVRSTQRLSRSSS